MFFMGHSVEEFNVDSKAEYSANSFI